MRLRPHHLLCTQGYGGKGYSNDFVQNMTALTNRLRGENRTTIDIVFSTDDICEKCPNMTGVDMCKDNDKVKRYDNKMIEYFGLEEKSYIYQDIVDEIDSKITESMLEDICSGCGWYPVSTCREKILGRCVKQDV